MRVLKDASTIDQRPNTDRNKRTGCLRGNALEDIVHKRVQDSHSLVRDTGIGVHLLEHCKNALNTLQHAQNYALKARTLVDVGRVGFLPDLLALLLLLRWSRSLLRCRRRGLLSSGG